MFYGKDDECTKELVLKKFIVLVKESTGFDAVGLRLKEGEDYPYYTTIGFTDAFVVAEMSLCKRDAQGGIVRDTSGMACLDCMCGNIIRGRTDPSFPFFTEDGSFCSNHTSALLAGTTPEQRGSDTRNRCNGEGYESVCLVPIRWGDTTIGLLQMNNREKDAFNLDMVHIMEDACRLLGEVIGPLLDSEDRARVELAAMGEHIKKSIDELKAKIAAL